jgi:hypothetical protein
MTLDPKKEFQDGLHAKVWADVAGSVAFSSAVTAALVIQQQTNSAPPDMATAASFAWKMEGAKQFASILMNLAEKAKPTQSAPANKNLRWDKP